MLCNQALEEDFNKKRDSLLAITILFKRNN